MNDFDEDVFSTAQLILDYFRTNPDAKDNLAGIAKWWICSNKDITGKALDFLVKKQKVTYDSSTKLYSKS